MLKKISILTLFESSFSSYFSESILKRAIQKQNIIIEIVDFRKYSKEKHFKVDDTPYGGAIGMVIQLQPIVDCLKTIKTAESHVILTTPTGCLYNQNKAKEYANNYSHLIIICGHYEGIDARIENYIDESISIGDYILTGGELPAMVIVDSITRLLDGVINKNSLISESFENNLLDYPVYTKPREFEGYRVPDVLLNGNHQKINEWRFNKQIEITKQNRPDLYKKYKERDKR